jgi:hypothetical protein
MRFLHYVLVPVAIVACGGASSTGLDDGGTTDGGDGAAQNGDGSTSDVVNPNPDSGLACPVESGKYSIQLSGAGCGDTSATVTECIQQTQCSIQIDFGGGSGKGLKSQNPVPIQSDGSFTGAAIEEGSATRTGCTATWTQSTHTLVVDCGGTNSTQSCIATLVRTSETCN